MIAISLLCSQPLHLRCCHILLFYTTLLARHNPPSSPLLQVVLKLNLKILTTVTGERRNHCQNQNSPLSRTSHTYVALKQKYEF